MVLFLVPLGLGGLSLAWRRQTQVWSAPEWVAQIFFWLALLALVLVVVLYAGTWLRHAAAARAEAGRADLLPYLGTAPAAILVVAAAGDDVATGLARGLWWVGALAQLVATVWIVDILVRRFDARSGRPDPAWLVPAVGALTVALGARTLGSVDLAWLAFGAGVVLWLGLWPLLVIRPQDGPGDRSAQDASTVAWPVAAPAAAMWAWQSLTGNVDDPVGRVLLAATLLFLVLGLVRLRELLAAPFTLTAWAYGFASSAAAVAAITMAGARPGLGYTVLASFLLTVATVATLAVGALSVRALLRRRLLAAE